MPNPVVVGTLASVSSSSPTMMSAAVLSSPEHCFLAVNVNVNVFCVLCCSEGFIVCRGFRVPDGFVAPPLGTSALLDEARKATGSCAVPAQHVTPFFACGSLHGFDADQSYALQHVSRDCIHVCVCVSVY